MTDNELFLLRTVANILLKQLKDSGTLADIEQYYDILNGLCAVDNEQTGENNGL